MANYPNWVAEVGYLDGANRDSTVQYYVPEATAKLYFAAANKAARDATAIGVLFADTDAITGMAHKYQRVYVEDVEAPVTLPAGDVLRGNKIVVGYQSGPRNFTVTIPGRDPAAYTQEPGSINIDITASGAFADWITQFEAACLSIIGDAVDVTKAYIND